MKAQMSEGYYKAITNYDTPGKSPCYWTPVRLSLLSPETRSRCLAYYCPYRPKYGRGVLLSASAVVLALDLAL
jgi:hypothetical protein